MHPTVPSSPPGSGSPARPSRYNLNRAQVVDENFIAQVRALAEKSEVHPTTARAEARYPGAFIASVAATGTIDADSGLTGSDLIELFESQVVARHQDIESRNMRARNEGFYTIGSAGHEGNAVLGRITRHTDPAFLHYRSGAFMAERARKVPGVDFTQDTMYSFAASALDPLAGGRHKVWGSKALFVPPQTSTIASHLPKAVGAAVALQRAQRLGVDNEMPPDAIVVCSFGDASTGHAVAQTAFNSAARATHQRIPVPLLFICEDNGIGISVETPPGWIEASFQDRCGLTYLSADGLNLIEAYRVAKEAVEHCRTHRSPVFLHLKVVRLLGHAGSDPETEYHSWDRIEAAEAKDPLPASARLVIERGLLSPREVLELYEAVRARVKTASAKAAKSPKLTNADEIMAPLAPFSPQEVISEAARTPSDEERIRVFGSVEQLPENGPPRHMAVLLNQGLHDLFIKYSETILFGEDVARKGGVYHVTTGLVSKFGHGRVFNTLLDETTILGLGLGAAHVGLLPLPEIQYLAYVHNAEDQIRGEACSLQFFSKDQFRNPMVVRIAGWGYQKGFGGHFHNDNSIAALRDIPGLIICTPSRGDDAVNMLRTCLALAKVDGRVVAFIEPIALYMARDLHEPKDGAWSFKYPPPGECIPFGEGAVYSSDGSTSVPEQTSLLRQGSVASVPRPSGSGPIRPADDLTILTFANGVCMSLRAQRTLREQHGLRARVVDLRWLNPLNETFIAEQALATGRVLVVDEGRRTGGIAEAILALIHERCGAEVIAARLTAKDTYIPLGAAANFVLPQDADVVVAAMRVLGEERKSRNRVLVGTQGSSGNGRARTSATPPRRSSKRSITAGKIVKKKARPRRKRR